MAFDIISIPMEVREKERKDYAARHSKHLERLSCS